MLLGTRASPVPGVSRHEHRTRRGAKRIEQQITPALTRDFEINAELAAADGDGAAALEVAPSREIELIARRPRPGAGGAMHDLERT